MKKIATLVLLTFSLSAFAQKSAQVEKQLKKINSKTQADKLKTKKSSWNIRVIDVNVNDTNVDPVLKSLNVGDMRTVEENGVTYVYKVLERKNVMEFRASHIYLSGDILSKSYIDSLRKTIIEQYKAGTDFSELSRMYSTYKRPIDGDLGWFKENIMVKEFEYAVKDHKKGDIFTIDIPSKNWYYVALKTYDDRITQILKIVKVKCAE